MLDYENLVTEYEALIPAVAEYEMMLTTNDNPYDPLIQPDEWAMFDEDVMHYNTRNFLARKVVWSDQMSENDKILSINQACLEIVSDPAFSWMYKIAFRKLTN